MPFNCVHPLKFLCVLFIRLLESELLKSLFHIDFDQYGTKTLKPPTTRDHVIPFRNNPHQSNSDCFSYLQAICSKILDHLHVTPTGGMNVCSCAVSRASPKHHVQSCSATYVAGIAVFPKCFHFGIMLKVEDIKVVTVL